MSAKCTTGCGTDKSVCITESGASPNLPCIFPFQYGGVNHTTCIWDKAHLTEHKPWCSTLVDEVGHHVEGQSNWGNCGPDCRISPDKRKETTAVPGRTCFLSLLAPSRPSEASKNPDYSFFLKIEVINSNVRFFGGEHLDDRITVSCAKAKYDYVQK